MYYQANSGEKILDAVAGLWCVNAGHCREKIVKAVQDQVQKMDYGLSLFRWDTNYLAICRKLTQYCPRA